MSLEQIIKNKIHEGGPISIAEYMDLCLSHPQYGYYIKKDPFGALGDFITAPEISQIFGELVGLWCADIWGQMGGGPAALMEAGPGRGTLMMDALRATRNIDEFHDHISVHLVETSPMLQTVQFNNLQNSHERLEWEEDLSNLPEKPILFIANEFLDALPIRQHVQTAQGMQERCVDVDAETNDLVFVNKPAGLSLAKGGNEIAAGTIIESCPAAKEVVAKIARHVVQYGGAALFIDYGYLGDSHQDTLQAVKNHAFHPVLKNPGDADVTAHVDFDTLREVAEDAGAVVHGAVEQGKFLVRLGAEMRTAKLLEQANEEQALHLISGVKRLIDPAQMGDLFKVMAILPDDDITPAGFYAARES